jgi:hypothetical protein
MTHHRGAGGDTDRDDETSGATGWRRFRAENLAEDAQKCPKNATYAALTTLQPIT